MYSPKRFVNEARRLGVQRAIAWPTLQTITWGQTILAGEYTKTRSKCSKPHDEPSAGLMAENKCDGCGGKGYTETPVASIFGFFQVDGLSYELPPEMEKLVASKLDIVKVVPPPPAANEQRACGSYGIGGSAYVNDSIEQIVAKIRESAKELKMNPMKFKYFLRGRFQEVGAPIVLEPCEFQRGYKRVQVEGLTVEQQTPKKAVFALYDYSRRKYMPKAERSKEDNVLLSEFVDSQQ